MLVAAVEKIVVDFVNPGDRCCCDGRHLPAVTTSFDWLRMRGRFWIRCWVCDLKIGPFTDRSTAEYVIQRLDEAVQARFSAGESQP